MKSETPREIAERVVTQHLGPRKGNPLMQQIGRAYEQLINDFESSLDAERERAAKIVNDARVEGGTDLRELVSRIRGGNSNAD